MIEILKKTDNGNENIIDQVSLMENFMNIMDLVEDKRSSLEDKVEELVIQ